MLGPPTGVNGRLLVWLLSAGMPPGVTELPWPAFAIDFRGSLDRYVVVVNGLMRVALIRWHLRGGGLI